MIDEKKNSSFSEDDKEPITDDERGIDDTLILSGQQATFTVTHFADAFIAVDHAGCTVVHRSSTAMKASDYRHVCSSLSLYTIYLNNGQQARWSPAQDLSTPPDA